MATNTKIDGIPTAEIEQDILDTEAEIIQAEREIEGFRIAGDRWSVMRANARVTTNQQRREFIEKLRGILAERKSDYSGKGV